MGALSQWTGTTNTYSVLFHVDVVDSLSFIARRGSDDRIEIDMELKFAPSPLRVHCPRRCGT